MSRLGTIAVTGVAIFSIAVVDFVSGVELRTFPLYYAPVALASWRFGVTGASVASAFSTLGWYTSNDLAGLQYTRPWIFGINALVQGISFVTVGLLVATLRRSQLRERRLARTDPLTELFNGRAFQEDGMRLLALCRRNRRPVTLICIDLDYFKTVNDRQGHSAGDRVLQVVGRALRSATRAADLPARLGGDEFAALFPELGADEVVHATDRLHRTLTEALAGSATGVTASAGVVTFLTPPADLETMIHAADELLYRAKEQGRNQLCRDVRSA
jgi:diguanylate cyclase (GGDEF)-like protein